MSAADPRALTDEALLRRRGELAYQSQMAALEGLSLDEAARAESKAVEEELVRRRLDPNTRPAKGARQR